MTIQIADLEAKLEILGFTGGAGGDVTSVNGQTGDVILSLFTTTQTFVAPPARGVDAAGRGTALLPYATPTYAMAVLSSTLPSTTPAEISMLVGTVIQPTNISLAMKKNTSLIGEGSNLSLLTLQGTGAITAGGFSGTGLSITKLQGFALTSTTGISFTGFSNDSENVQLRCEDLQIFFGPLNLDSNILCTSNKSRYNAVNIGTTGGTQATFYSDGDFYQSTFTLNNGSAFITNASLSVVSVNAGAGDTSVLTIQNTPGVIITATASGGGVATVIIDPASYTGSNVTLVGDATIQFLGSVNPPTLFQSLLRTTDFSFDVAPSTYNEFSWDTTVMGYVPGTIFFADPGLQGMPSGYQFTIGLVSDESNPFTYAMFQRLSSENAFFAIYTGQRVLVTALPDGTGEGGFGYDITGVYGGGHLQITNDADFRMPPGYLAVLEVVDGDIPKIITVNPICDFAALSYKSGQTLTILNNSSFNVLIEGQTVPVVPGQYGMITCAQDIYGEGSFFPGVLTWSAA